MNWLSRYWKPAAAVSVLVAGAIAAGVLWPTSPDQDPARPILAQLDQTSTQYLSRHAQPWLTCPAAATKCYRWKMQEAAGNLTDDLSGDSAVLTAVGTPTYRIHTPIPDTTGMNGRRGIAFNGSSDYFDAAVSATGDVTTNNFDLKGWACPQSVTSGYLVSKINGGVGYDLYFNAGALTLRITDGGGTVAGSVGTWPVVSATNIVGCRYYQVRVDRAGNATADFDGVNSGVNLNVSARNLTLSNAVNLRIGRSAAGGATYYTGNLSEVLVGNGLGTLAEMTAEYKAFKVPTSTSVPGIVGSLTYSQTTTRKFPLPPEAGFGERLGVYAGSATNPQWPVGYDATKVDATKNPLGIGFPESRATTNIIGYANEFNSWTAGAGAPVVIVTPNVYEAPDGSMTADKVEFDGTANSFIRQGPATAPPAGSAWYFSVYAKKISGTATHLCIRPTVSGGGYSGQLLTSSWKRHISIPARAYFRQGIIQCATNGGFACSTAMTDCVIALADAQYEENNVTPPCTSTTGNVSQTCNASYYTLDWTSKASLMPLSLDRFEVINRGSSEPLALAPTDYQVKWMLGNKAAYLAEGTTTSLVIKNQGGAPEYVANYRGVGHTTESRDYTSSWDFRNGLTNTSPRKYGGLSVARSGARSVYAPFSLEGRTVQQTTNPVTPVNQRDLNATKVYVGCDGTNGSPVNCSQGIVENLEVYGRPAQDIKSDDSTVVLNADFSYPRQLQVQTWPDIQCPTGMDRDKCYIWDFNDYAGFGIYDKVHNFFMAGSATNSQPTSGILGNNYVRGQGRKGINFASASNEYISGASNDIASIGTATSFELDITATVSPTYTATQNLVGSSSAATAGIGMWLTNANRVYCNISDGVNARNCYATTYGWLGANNRVIRKYTCRSKKTAGTWDSPQIYQSGYPMTMTCAGVQPTGNLANGATFRLGDIGSVAANRLNGEIHEVRLSAGGTYDNATVLADYLHTTRNGTYLPDNGSTIAHYYMNEAIITNGAGVLDHSGNGNHLTVVGGTPDPQYSDMPYPAGNVKAHTVNSGTGNSSYNTTAAPAGMVFSAGCSYTYGMIQKNGTGEAAANSIWWGLAGGGGVIVVGSTTSVYCSYATSVGITRSTAQACPAGSDSRDGSYHLMACAMQWDGNSWNIRASCDGQNWSAWVDNGDAGAFSHNNLYFFNGNASSNNYGSIFLFKDYLLSDTEIAAIYAPLRNQTPLSSLTYTRTTKACYETDVHPWKGPLIRCFVPNEIPHAYEGTSASGFAGIPVHPAITNYAWYSNILGSWGTVANVTIATGYELSPMTDNSADRVTETVANAQHYVQHTTTYTVPQNEYMLMRAYLRYGSTTWANIYMGDAAGSYAYTPVNMTTAAVGTPGVVGADWANATASVYGSTTGWMRVLLSAQCIKVGGCTFIQGACSNNADGACATYVGATANYFYPWGYQAVNTGATANLQGDYGVYCPSMANASTTCNSSSAYITAANISTWDRSQAQIDTITYSRNATGYGWDLSNGVNNNGRSYQLSQGSETYVYNSAGVLQNRYSLANAQINLSTGIITSWDNTSTYYTDPNLTARRSYSKTNQSTYYGTHDTRTTDVGAAWTVTDGSNFYLGQDNAGANKLNGLYVRGQVYSTR